MGIAALALGACSGGEAVVPQDEPPRYLGVEAIRMADDLVILRADAAGPEGAGTAVGYAECAAAGYAVAEGFVLARHVRTTLSEEGGVWRADAVYTLSPEMPRGIAATDAETTVATCGASGIPTV